MLFKREQSIYSLKNQKLNDPYNYLIDQIDYRQLSKG